MASQYSALAIGRDSRARESCKAKPMDAVAGLTVNYVTPFRREAVRVADWDLRL
jgi:hypothetical protein